MNTAKLKTITGAAREVEAPAAWLRARDSEIQPIRDDAGRRLYAPEHLERARELRRKRAAR